VTPRLASLVRKELIRPDKPQLPGDDAFRFRHLLIRDAAYDAVAKSTRAELHERYAGWLEERGQDLVELDEILGHHLEQAARYKQELGHADPQLAERAGERLSAVGRRAFLRGDNQAAASLLERALELTRPLRLDVVLELDLAQAVQLQDSVQASEIAGDAAERAHAVGDEAGELLARTAAAFHRSWFLPDPDIDELERVAFSALPLLEQGENHAGLVHVWGALGYGVANFRARWDDWTHAGEQALHHARLAGLPPRPFLLDLAIASGSKPADEALRALDELVPAMPHPGASLTRAWLLAMLGRFEDAWPIAQQARDRMWELTGAHRADWIPAGIAALGGDHEAAVGYLHPLCESLRERDERFYLSSAAPMLGRELCALDRYDEAERWSQIARGLGVRQSVLGEATWRQVQARVHASRGEHEKADKLARAAIALMEQSDGLNYQGDAYFDVAEVLQAAGRTEEAAVALEQALERYSRKKNLAMVAQVRPRLERLRAGVPQPQ
jgi:tetratricopeptide (TPR) repeat protein